MRLRPVGTTCPNAPCRRIAAGRGCTLGWSCCCAARAVDTPPGRLRSRGQFQETNPTVARCTGGRKCDPPRGGRITGRSPSTNPTVSPCERARKMAGRFSAPPPPKPPAACSRWSWGRRPGRHQGCLAPYPARRNMRPAEMFSLVGLRQASPAGSGAPLVPPTHRNLHAHEKRRAFPAGARALPGTWSGANGQKFAAGERVASGGTMSSCLTA